LQANVFVFKASVSGIVFNDANANGRLDFSDRALIGQTVQLLDAKSGQVLATTKTGLFGTYSFDVTEAGQYVVQVATSGASTAAAVPSRAINITSGNQFLRQVNLAVAPNRNPGHPTKPGNTGGGSTGSDPGGWNWNALISNWNNLPTGQLLASIVDRIHAAS
jgi:hypothetical protein